ncbi:hypothetical protein A9406_07945, partial [Campylobacter lari]|nr:hypothetical protein [Campylobacter lari]
MECYLHIGVEKTGSTSIQQFLYINREAIKEQGYYFAQSVGLKNHWDLAFLGYSLFKKDSYVLNNFLSNTKEILLHKQKIIRRLQIELKGKTKVIFSSELLQSRLTSKNELKKLKKILYFLGFKKIYIICYIRNHFDMLISLYSEAIKWGEIDTLALYKKNIEYEFGYKKNLSHFYHICDYKNILQLWGSVFGKKQLIVRIFDKKELYKGNLIKDFANSISLKWCDKFEIPSVQNKSLDLLGIQLFMKINPLLPLFIANKSNNLRGDIHLFAQKKFSSDDQMLKFRPPKKNVYSYLKHFEESNEWVRKEFFSHKERLFPKKDLSNYKENYELKEMKPEYWDKIAEFVADLVSSK